MRNLLLLLAACGADPAPPAEPDCPPCPTCEAAPSLPAWQLDLLSPLVAELDRGPAPVGPEGWGLCAGKVQCERFLGATPGELPPGEYIVRAALGVPGVGEGWGARFDVRCESRNRADQVQVVEHSRDYALPSAVGEGGYRLEPLWRVQSPHSGGARSCTFTLTPRRPDGVEMEPLRGSYSTPQPPLESE